MPEKHLLAASSRDFATSAKKHQQAGFLLANIYGHGDSQSIVVANNAAAKLLSEIGESSVIYLSVDNKKDIPVLLGEVQRDPLSGKAIHISFRRVDLKEKVRAMIPIETTGEFKVPQALFLLVHSEVEAEALPTDLPESFVVDVGQFSQIDEQVTFADLSYNRQKVTLLVENETEPVVVVNAVKEEIEAESEENSEAIPETVSTPTA